MEIKKDKENTSIMMEAFMKEIGSMIKKVAMGYLNMSMAISIMDSGPMI
jgi:hypothetical protein